MALPREVRKTVTVLFCDVVGSTELGERFDPETVRSVMSRYFDEMREALERHGGTVEKFIGDAVMAVFGVPVVHEDDALRAALAAVEMRDRLARLNEELGDGLRLQLRIGINTGEVVAGEAGKTLVTGDAVNVASRLEHAAGEGEILLGGRTRRLLGAAALADELGPLPVRGKVEPVPVWRLSGLHLETASLRSDTPFVGRDEELGRLRDAYSAVVRDRSCRLVTLLGNAGVGKSRLACELFDELEEDATVLVGRCLPYGDGITFLPVTELIRRLGGDEALERLLADEEDVELVFDRLCGLTGRGPAAAAEETFWALRRVFEVLARQRPLVLCVEDIHWAEPTLLDLIEYLAGWTREGPLLLLCLARPDLLDLRPTWAHGPGATISLQPLGRRESATLLESLGVPEAARGRLADAAEGNPFFAEQLAAMAGEDAGGDELPPTIQALLAARLDRLPANERAVLERAAVAGREFSHRAIAALSPAEERASLATRLLSLVRRDLLRPEPRGSGADDRFRFAHGLVRDAAYAALAKAARAELHQSFADWLERTAPDEPELEELVGYHLEQAHRTLVELGRSDGRSAALAARAARLLATGGRRASRRGDPTAAVNLLRRADALAASDDALALDVELDLGVALHEAGDLRHADAVLAQAARRADRLADSRAAARVRLEQAFAQTHAGTAKLERAVRQAEEAAEVLAAADDEHGVSRALAFRIRSAFIRCRLAETEALALEALEHAPAEDDVRALRDVVRMLARAVVRGATPVEEAIARCNGLRAGHGRDPVLDAVLLGCVAVLEAMRCSFDEARRLVRASERAVEDLGHPLLLALARADVARVELLAGDAAAAARPLRRSCELLQSLGETGYLSTSAALLAEALLAAGDDEAGYYIEVSERTSLAEDVLSQTLWRAARAQVRAREGRHAQAERLARAAVGLAEATDDLTLRAGALESLGAVLAAARDPSWDDAHARARELHERKGNLAALARVGRQPSVRA